MQPQSSLTISIIIAVFIIGGSVFYSENQSERQASAQNPVSVIPAPLAPTAPQAAFVPAAGAGAGCGIPRS